MVRLGLELPARRGEYALAFRSFSIPSKTAVTRQGLSHLPPPAIFPAASVTFKNDKLLIFVSPQKVENSAGS